MLSAVIITKNEQGFIRDCLQSVAFADEIIVVDNISSDNTVAICKEFTDKVILTKDWPGFGVQKSRALERARGDWVLSLDADERISIDLKQEILSAIQQDKYSAYQIPRQSQYCGRWIKHSGWSPDYVLRLFRRDSAHFSDDIVHEKVQLNTGKMGSLSSPIQHYSYNSVEEVLDKTNRYSTANALKSYQQGKKSSLSKAIFHGLWAFFRTYIIRAGFLDGQEGFILAVSNAEVSYYRYIKLIYLLKKNRIKKSDKKSATEAA
ncbi:MAG: glycosyltransferase family 2 protein [Pseudomonadota bacterium]